MKKAAICTLFAIFISVLCGIQIDALKVDYAFTGYYFSANGKQEPWIDSNIKFHQGEIAYCISLYDDVSWDDVYDRTPLEKWDSLTEKERETVTAIAAFGYGYNGRTDPIYYSAASDLIWHITDVPRLQQMRWVDSNFNAADAKMETAKAEIMNDVNRYFKLPTFTAYDENQQVIGTDYAEAFVGKKVTFVDTAGVLTDLAVVSSSFSNHDVNISQNTVIVNVSKNTEESMTFSSGIAVEAKEIPFLLTSSQYQNMIVRGRLEPLQVQIAVKGLGTSVQIEKKDNQGNAVNGAVLQLFDETENHTLIAEFVTETNAKIIRGLNPEHTYCVHEVNPPTGYFRAEDQTFIPEKDMTVVIEDQKIDLSVKKINERGQSVTGADLRLLDATGNQLAQWTSDENPWQIGSFVEAGQTYVIYEMSADDSYYLSEMRIQVPGGTCSDPIVLDLVNEHISYAFEKTDLNGNAVSGAKLGLYDETDGSREVFIWHTSNEPLQINTLRRGHRYVLKELESPAGYTKADDISFLVEERLPENASITIRMQNAPIDLSIIKTDAETGQPLKGAKMKLTSLDHKTIIDEWESTEEAHVVNHLLLEHGKSYLLEETEAPAGWQKNKQQVRIRIPDEGNAPVTCTFSNQPMRIRVLKTDAQNAPLENAVLELKDMEGNLLHTWKSRNEAEDISAFIKEESTYSIHEVETVDGRYLAEDIVFTATNCENPIVIQMVDEAIEVEVLKLSEDGDWLEGAKMELSDEENGKVIDTWKTVNQAHAVGHLLKHGKTYRIKETEWVNGVHQAVEKVFQVPDTSPEEKIQLMMIDTDVSISFLKTDVSGKQLAGAKLAIIEKNEDGSETLLAEFVSDESSKGVSQLDEKTKIGELLMGGHTYILREVEAPFGYETAADLSFCVNGTKEIHQVITLLNQPMKKTYRIHKVNASNHDVTLSGAEFQIYRAGDTEAYASGFSNEDGIFEIDLPYEKDGYRIREVKAPDGYRIAKEETVLVMDGTIDFSDPEPIDIYIENIKEIPDTGDQNPFIVFRVFLSSLIAIAILVSRRIHLRS